MRTQNPLLAYILIGIGVFFLLRELKVPIITDFYSWQTLLIIVGLAYLIHSYRSRNYQQIFIGVLILGIGIHLHGSAHYHFWIDHWAIYVIIIGLAYLIRYFKTKSGFLPGIAFLAVGVLFIYSPSFQAYFYWLNDVISFVASYWPIVLIILGFVLLRKGK